MPKVPLPAPGQVWWCDGTALCFEPHFKRRPVLLVGLKEEEWFVIPLSSKRHYGQETAVCYGSHVSYLSGELKTVSFDSLRAFRGSWDGFELWSTEQKAAAHAVTRYRAFWQKLFAFLKRA